jgi:hypothetical protein
MHRLVTVLLLVCTLLACPFECMGHAAGRCGSVGDGASVSKPACHCCARQCPAVPAPSTDEAPGTPARGVPCGDCLCCGAVLPDHTDFMLSVGQAEWQATPCVVPANAAELLSEAAWIFDNDPPHALAFGRSLRLAVQSLQI